MKDKDVAIIVVVYIQLHLQIFKHYQNNTDKDNTPTPMYIKHNLQNIRENL